MNETGGKKRRPRYGDEDEIEQENEDRKRRRELDKLFSDFAKRIEKAAQDNQHDLEVDMPFRDLGFTGVPKTGQTFSFSPPPTVSSTFPSTPSPSLPS